MGPDEKGMDQVVVYMDGKPMRYVGAVDLPEITIEPENMVRVDVPKLIASTEITAEDIMERQEAPPLLASLGLTVEQANEAARYLAEAFRIFYDQLAEAARAVADAWGAIVAAEEFRKALRWAEAANKPLACRYHRTKKKRIRKKYAKRILAWYRQEVL